MNKPQQSSKIQVINILSVWIVSLCHSCSTQPMYFASSIDDPWTNRYSCPPIKLNLQNQSVRGMWPTVSNLPKLELENDKYRKKTQ